MGYGNLGEDDIKRILINSMGTDKNICIIGGGGFIGSGLRKYLLSFGIYKIYIIGRLLNIELFENEFYFSIHEYSYKYLKKLFLDIKFEAVIDLAYTSIPNTSYDDPVKDFSENLYNVIKHLEFATAIKSRRFVCVSSGGTIYGESTNYTPFTEQDPNYPLSPYGITKLACERYVLMYHRLHGLKSIIVRPSNIYGPGQKPFRGQGIVATSLGLASQNKPIHIFGTGSNVRDYLFISDFCAGLMNIIDRGNPGEIYNLGSGQGHTILNIIDFIEAVVLNDNLHLRREYQSERAFDVHYSVLDIKKISNLSDWRPNISLVEGIRLTWQWVKKYMEPVM